MQLYAADQDTKLVEYLRGRSIEPDCVAPYVYASDAEDERVLELIEQLAQGKIDAIAFTSKAQIQRLRKLARDRKLEEKLRKGLAATRVAAIGPVVERRARGRGNPRRHDARRQLLDEAARHGALRAAGQPMTGCAYLRPSRS